MPTPEEKAREIGAKHGRNQAGWWIQENLTKNQDATVYAQKCLEWMDEGDPLFYDSLPYADLTGQWADSYGQTDLVRDCGLDPADRNTWEQEPDLCDIYEEAFNAELGAEIRAACEHELEPEESPHEYGDYFDVQ